MVNRLSHKTLLTKVMSKRKTSKKILNCWILNTIMIHHIIKVHDQVPFTRIYMEMGSSPSP